MVRLFTLHLKMLLLLQKCCINSRKKMKKIVIKAGSYNGEVMSAAQVAELASIPSREELLSKLLFVMQAPLSGLARGLAALAEKKAGEETA